MRKRIPKGQSQSETSFNSENKERPITQRETVIDDSEVVKQASTFTAVLFKAASYDLVGISFSRGVPKKVPMQHYEIFKNNGWFRVKV